MKNNVLGSVLIQLGNYLIPIITMPILTRILSKEDLGYLLLYLSCVPICAIIFDVGNNHYAIGQAKRLNTPKRRSIILSKIYCIRFIIFFISLAIILLASIFTSFSVLDASLILLGGVLFSLQDNWISLNENNMIKLGVYNIAGKFIYLFGVFLVWAGALSPSSLFQFWILGLLLTAVLQLSDFRRRKHLFRLMPLKRLQNHLIKTLPFFWSRAASATYNYSSSIVVAYFGSIQQVGLLRVAEQFYRLGQGFTAPIINPLYTKMSRKPDPYFFMYFCGLIVVPVICFSTYLFVYSEEIIVIVFGVGFVEAASGLQVYAFLIVVNCLGTIAGYPAYALLGLEKEANAAINLALVPYSVSLAIILFYGFSINLFVTCLVITEAFVLVYRLSDLYRKRSHIRRSQ